jgi:6-pyruvoyl-tetrahydropterin synthase
MFEISVTGEFVATHRLRYPDGSVESPHEHHWRVTVTYGGAALNEAGLLLDFQVARSHLAEVLRTLDGHDLNVLRPFTARNPSAENVALVVAERLPHDLPGAARLRCVAVEEEPGCVARCSLPTAPPGG